jgi:hypothetical protein
MRRRRYIYIVALIVLIPLVGYALMHALAYIVPMSEHNVGANLIFTVTLIALGLLIPYWMLKLGFHKAHMRDPAEKDFHLGDLPKDKDQIAHGPKA